MSGLNHVISNIAICADDTTLYSKWDQASDMWQQAELASELESDLWDTVDWVRKTLVDFNVIKNQLISFGWSDNIQPKKQGKNKAWGNLKRGYAI